MSGKSRLARGGFSLVELIVVLGIIAILSALAAPSLVSMLRGSALTQASAEVEGLLNLAHQSALAENQSVEVRIYQYADPAFPGESAGSPATGKYRAFQLFIISDAGAGTALGKMEALPTGIIVDSGPALSSLVEASQVKSWTPLDPQVALPKVGTSYNCCAFRMRTNGTTSLSTTPPKPPGAWCLTLHSITLGDKLAVPPTNFSTILIDPIAAKVTTFRP